MNSFVRWDGANVPTVQNCFTTMMTMWRTTVDYRAYIQTVGNLTGHYQKVNRMREYEYLKEMDPRAEDHYVVYPHVKLWHVLAVLCIGLVVTHYTL